jgi:hypothetical protein
MDFRNNSDAQGSRGLRNNNVGNIRYNANINWQGQVGQDDLNYSIFSDATYGARAMALNLYNNYYVDGIKTFTQLISKYAPADDPTATNDPTQYASYVSQQTGIPVNVDMKLSGDNILPIMRAMMNEELGTKYSSMVSDADLQQGISMINKFQVAAIATEGFIKNNPMTVVAIAGGAALAISVYLYFMINKFGKK